MTLETLRNKLRTAALGTTFGLAGLGLSSTDGCDQAIEAAAAGFAIGLSEGYESGGYYDDGSYNDGSYDDDGYWYEDDGYAGTDPHADEFVMF